MKVGGNTIGQTLWLYRPAVSYIQMGHWLGSLTRQNCYLCSRVWWAVQSLVDGKVCWLCSQDKVLDKIQNPLLVKILNKLSTERMYLNIINPIYGKPTANTVLSVKRLKNFPLREIKQK